MSKDPNFDIASAGGYTNGTALFVNGTESVSPDPYQPYPVSLVIDGQPVSGTIFSSPFGTWRGSIPYLASGPHTVTAIETIGSQTYTSRTVTYDVVRQFPTISFTNGSASTNQARQTLTGTVSSTAGPGAVAGQKLTVSEGGQTLGQAVVGQDGSWSLQVTLPHLGPNLISAMVTDAAGNVGYGGTSYLYETAPHAVAVTSAGGLTNQPVQTVTGTATSQDAITLTDNGVVVGSTTTNADGTWRIRATLGAQGANVVQAVDTSPAGNVGTSATVSYTLDTVPPTVAITSAAISVTAASDTETVTGTAEVGSAVTLFRDGNAVAGAAVAADGTWSAQVALHVGPNGLTAQATDVAGNVGVSATVVDTLYPAQAAPAPVAQPSVSIASAGGLTAQRSTTVSGVAAASSAVTLYDNGAAVSVTTAGADGSWALALTLAEGVNILTATDVTAAGFATGNSIAAVLDTTPPSVAFDVAPQVAGTVATLTGSASDASGIAGVEIFDGATDLGAAHVGADGSWAFTHDFGHGLLDHLTAVATDGAGNSAAASAAYGLDTAVPGRPNLSTTTARDAGGAITSVTTRMADGTIGAQTVSNGDGTATSTGYENGQALFSIGNDVMTGTGYRENFVFQPTMGHARITDFVVAGAGHDTITLSHQDFLNIAQVLNSTTMNHGSAMIHISADDTIRLAGVTKAQLVQHRGDFAFTP